MDDMYSSKELSKPAGQTTRETVDEENEEDSAKTALVPKSLCGKDYKVGDTISFTVSADYGDELELKPSAESEDESEDEGEEEETKEPEYSSADDAIDAMDEKE